MRAGTPAQHDLSQEEPPAAMARFAELGLSKPILTALRDAGYETPTAIQSRTIPALLAGSDVVGQVVSQPPLIKGTNRASTT